MSSQAAERVAVAATQDALYAELDLDLSWSEQELPERERTKHVHRLHPYLGKFVPQLVEVLLGRYVRPAGHVLDPFAGSGTTLVQGLESGRSAIQVIGPNAAPLIENNAIHTQLFNQRTGIVMQESDAVVRNNVLTDNYFGIYVYLGEPRIENNTIRNGWRGVWIVGADPLLVNNTIEGNGLPSIGGEGLLMTFASPILRDNVIQNNGVGVDIPYDSKGALPLSRGNVVNGIPLETLYRVGERDLEIEGVELDSGRGSGTTTPSSSRRTARSP